jgi:hypothetical protein
MKNIHILPTDKPSRLTRALHYTNSLRLVHKNYKCDVKDEQYQNIYITSDEEIKEDDWCLFNQLEIVKCTYSKNGEYLFSSPLKSSSNHHFSYFKKIILTTDPELIKDGVQAIDDEFLEWFIKNPNCEEIEVIPLRKSSGYYDEKEVWHWDFSAGIRRYNLERPVTCVHIVRMINIKNSRFIMNKGILS